MESQPFSLPELARTPAVIITADMREAAFQEGRDAYECGLDAGDCPEYGGMTTLRLSWFQGFDSGDGPC